MSSNENTTHQTTATATTIGNMVVRERLGGGGGGGGTLMMGSGMPGNISNYPSSTTASSALTGVTSAPQGQSGVATHPALLS